MYRLIASLAVVLVCVGGYLAFNHNSGSAPAFSDAAQSQSASAAAAPSDDLPTININK